MRFTRNHSVLVPFKDILNGNIFKEPNDNTLYIKINSNEAVRLTGTFRLLTSIFAVGMKLLLKILRIMSKN